jgi:protein-S-isoprenylcysteine O-methyltransferase Ste14
MRVTDWPLALLWACWAGYWILAAAGCRRAARTEARSSRLAHLLLLASSYALLFLEPITTGVLATPILQATPITQPSSVLYGLYGSGFALTACGLGLATWARVHIGQNWSGTVAIRSEQRLVEGGP